jgi:hypothetical protein
MQALLPGKAEAACSPSANSQPSGLPAQAQNGGSSSHPAYEQNGGNMGLQPINTALQKEWLYRPRESGAL